MPLPAEEKDVTVHVTEERISRLAELSAISIAFPVERMLDVSLVDGGLGGIVFSEVALEEPWLKDYDDTNSEGPATWAERFDVTNWGLIAARYGERLVGGAVIAFDTPDVYMLQGRSDLAVLWDIRVHPEARSAGTGTRLFQSAERWARRRGCLTLKAETQSINVPACRFYQRMGCTLGGIDRFAYPELPNEVQLIWLKHL